MNVELIDILELIVVLKFSNRNKLCGEMKKPHLKCDYIDCSECIFNTSKVYIDDYPIQIIEVKGMLDER